MPLLPILLGARYGGHYGESLKCVLMLCGRRRGGSLACARSETRRRGAARAKRESEWTQLVACEGRGVLGASVAVPPGGLPPASQHGLEVRPGCVSDAP